MELSCTLSERRVHNRASTAFRAQPANEVTGRASNAMPNLTGGACAPRSLLAFAAQIPPAHRPGRKPCSRRKGGPPIGLDSGVRSRVDTSRMSSCCGSPDSALAALTPRCPRSGTKGLAVDLVTVNALLREAARTAVRKGPYRFCADPACAVVYFDAEGHVFTSADLSVPVWQKEPAGARMICYCFDENEASMAREFIQTGRCDAARRVRDHITAGRCACEVRSPRGACCLGDVMKAAARIEAECASVVEDTANG